MVLIEERPLPDITAFFARIGFRLEVHGEQPPAPTTAELSNMPSVVRRARRDLIDLPPASWVDVCLADGTIAHRWYGSGSNPEEAIRRAAARWRVEQGQTHA